MAVLPHKGIRRDERNRRFLSVAAPSALFPLTMRPADDRPSWTPRSHNPALDAPNAYDDNPLREPPILGDKDGDKPKPGLPPADPRLTALMERWEQLPEAIRNAIAALTELTSPDA